MPYLCGTFEGMDTRKIIQALAYLANSQPDKKMDNMKAYKLLWLVDRYHLRRYGRTVTGDAYYAMPHGIVPSDAKCILEGMPTKLTNSTKYQARYIVSNSDHTFKVIAEPDIKTFSDSDQEALDAVIRVYGNRSARFLSQLSHKFPEWLFYRDFLNDKDLKNSYKVDLDRFFEDSPNTDNQLFDESAELLMLTKELYHQYCRA